jgi:hypothetical protein
MRRWKKMKLVKIVKSYAKTIPTGDYASKKIMVSLEIALDKGEKALEVSRKADIVLNTLTDDSIKNLR